MAKLEWPLEAKIMSYIAGGFVPAHPAYDIGGPNLHGAPIFAAEAGVIQTVQYSPRPDQVSLYNGLGNFIYLVGAEGRVWEYGHLITFDLPNGTRVSPGQQIGRMGNTGWVVPNPQMTGNPLDGTHLHFGLEINQSRVDPLAYIRDYNSNSAASTGGTLVKNIYVITSDDYLGLESVILKLYGDLTKYYDVISWNPELQSNPHHIAAGQQIVYYTQAASVPAPTPAPDINEQVSKLQAQLATARGTIEEGQITIKNLEREYAVTMVREIQSREDAIGKLKSDLVISEAARRAQVERLQKEIDTLRVGANMLGNVNLDVASIITEILNKTGIFHRLVKAWEGFVDGLSVLPIIQRFPMVAQLLESKRVKSLLKYDIFILVGMELGTFIANVLGAHLDPVSMRNLTAFGILVKQQITLYFDTNKDGVLSAEDYQVLRDYLPQRVA